MDSSSKQRGAALIVGLVLLMALTVLAISTMRSSTMELTMASNAQLRDGAFQVAEAGIAATSAGIAANLIVPGTGSTVCDPSLWGGYTTVPNDPRSGRYRTRLCYVGATLDLPIPGFGIGEFEQLHFTVESQGETLTAANQPDPRGGKTQHTMGFFMIGNK